MNAARIPLSMQTTIALAGATILLAPTVMTRCAYADFFLHPWESHHQRSQSFRLSGEFGYFSTSSNYDTNGVPFVPTGLTGYNRISSDFVLDYGLSSRLTVFGRMSWARVELSNASRPGTSFGLTDQTLGAGFRLFASESSSSLLQAIDLQAQADLPGYSNANAEANLTPYLGDQSMDFSGGVLVTGRVWETKGADFLLVAGGGYTYRTQGFSAALPWSANLAYSPKRGGLNASVGLNGFQSLSTDSRFGSSGAATDSSITSPGTGGSFITGAINPSLITANGQIGYESDEGYKFFARFSQTMAGKAAPYGMNFSGGLQMRFGSSGSNRGHGASNRGLVSYAYEARVIRVNDRLNLVKIDKGTQDGVAEGQIFDIFSLKPDGTIREPIARAQVTSVKAAEAALTITEYFKEVWIEEGFIAKKPLE